MDLTTAGGPSGPTGPTLAMNIDNSEPVDPGKCRFPGCGRVFASAQGRGIHEQRMHKNFNDAINIETHACRRPQWSDEELALLARREARLTYEGVKFLNKGLSPFFPNRTLESIKFQRRPIAHKNRVAAFISELEQEEMSEDQDILLNPTTDNALNLNFDFNLSFEECIKGLDKLRTNEYQAFHLQNICQGVGSWSIERIFDELGIYINSIFPIIKTGPNQQKTGRIGIAKPMSKRKARKCEYAKAQNAWSKNPCRYIKSLMESKVTDNPPDQQNMTAFWKITMTQGSDVSPTKGAPSETIRGLWDPVTQKEIISNYPKLSTSPGIDGITSRQLRAVPVPILLRIFLLFQVCGKLPERLLMSKTTLIPKKDNAVNPEDYRPITIQSILTRTFNKILASRIIRLIKFDKRQRAFLPTDGCAANILELDLILKYHRKHLKPLFMASMDIAKAFDSISHKTLRETLIVMGLPAEMSEYLVDSYKRSKTMISFNGWRSEEIHPTCGVKQGDPLSPLIFNMVIDRLIRQLPPEVGSQIGPVKYNALMFADDMLIFAVTPEGLQLLLDTVTGFLQKCGLNINVGKSFTVSIRTISKMKKSAVDGNQRFKCGGRELPALKREDQFTYLGIPFTPDGKLTVRADVRLGKALEKLSRAPLKPQQRLFALRAVVLPGIYHLLTLGDTTLGKLRKVDTMTRTAAKKWLDLPHDVPNAYFHAHVKDGGLSIPSVRWLMPLHRAGRLRNLTRDTGERTTPSHPYFLEEIQRANRRLLDGQTILDSREKITKRWASVLMASVDGRGLRMSRKVPQQHNWITDGSRLLSGRDFVNSVKLRINALPTRSRTARGRTADRSCRGGCNAVETLNHILQQCHRTHKSRIARHDAVTSYVKRALDKRHSKVEEEPHFISTVGLRKPDLIAIDEDSALVVDAQVVSEHIDLDIAHATKADKYRELENQIKRKYGVRSVGFYTATLNWRGVWSPQSAKDLISLKILKSGELKVISSRVIIGGLASFWRFSKTTSWRRAPNTVRTGVG